MDHLKRWQKEWGRKRLIALDEMQEVSASLSRILNGGEIICLIGPIGSGKTTLIQQIGVKLGIKDAILSPSFNLYEKYRLKNNLFIYHFDLYRIEELKEFDNLEFEDIWGMKENIVLIEWPEKAKGLVPRPNLELHLSLPDMKSGSLGDMESFWANFSEKVNRGRIFYAKYLDI